MCPQNDADTVSLELKDLDCAQTVQDIGVQSPHHAMVAVCLPRTMRAAICEGATIWFSIVRTDTTWQGRRERNQSVPRQVSQEGCLLAGPAGAVMVLVTADDWQLEELATQLQPGGLLRLRGTGSISLA